MSLALYLIALAAVGWLMVGNTGHIKAICCGAGCVECGDSHPHKIIHPQLYGTRQWNQH